MKIKNKGIWLFNLILILLSPWIMEFLLINYMKTDGFIKNKNITVQKNNLLNKNEKIIRKKLQNEGYEPTVYPSILSRQNFIKIYS